MATSKKQASAKATPPPEKERRKRRTMSQSDTIEFWTDEDFFVSQRKIYLGSIQTDAESNESNVDAAMSKKFEKAMTVLEYFDKKSPITIILNTYGGDYYHGLAIYDRIMDSPCFVTIQGTGPIMSMGAIILQAGDKRLLTRNATLMLHYGTSGHDGHMLNEERAAQENTRLRLLAEEIFLGQMQKKDPSITLEKVRDLLRFDSFFDPNKAIRLGLADGLTPRTKHRKAKTTPPPQPAPQTPSS